LKTLTDSGHREHADFVCRNAEVVRDEIAKRISRPHVAASVAVFTVMMNSVTDVPPRGMLRDLLCLFFDGTLQGSSTQYAPLVQDHREACGTALRALAEIGVYTTDGQQTDVSDDTVAATDDTFSKQRGYVCGTFVVKPGTDIAAVHDMFARVNACFAFSFAGKFTLDLMGVDSNEFQSMVSDDRDVVTQVMEQLFVTYDGPTPFTNCHLDPSDDYNLSARYGDQVVVFTIWESHWDKPTSLLETRLADAVRDTGFVVPV
jgi:hypothetical protein